MNNVTDFETSVSEAMNYSKPYIYSRYSISEEDLQDAQQNAAFKSWKYRNSFKADSSFNTWFLKILRNEVLSILKKNADRKKIFSHDLEQILMVKEDKEDKDGKEETKLSLDPIENETKTPFDSLRKRDDIINYRLLINYAYSCMDKTHIQVLKLSIENDMGYAQISELLKIPIGTVMSRVFYAKKRAKNLIMSYVNGYPNHISAKNPV